MATRKPTNAEANDRDAQLARAEELRARIAELTGSVDEATPVAPTNPRDFVNDRMNELGSGVRKKKKER